MNEPLRAEKAPAAQHTLRMENCERLVATGIEAIVSYDAMGAVLKTPCGMLNVGGEGLSVGELSVRTGEVSISGSIEYVQYTRPREKNSGRLFQKAGALMLAPVTPPEAVRDLFLSMGLGAWLCAGYTLLRAALGSTRWAVFACDALFAFGALVAWRPPPSAFFSGVAPLVYAVRHGRGLSCPARLLAAPARRLRTHVHAPCAVRGRALARLAEPVRQPAHNWRAAACKMRAAGKRRAGRGQKTWPAPHKTVAKKRAGVV